MKKSKHIVIQILMVLSALFYSQCTVTHHLQADQKLLVKHKITADNRKINKAEISNYIKPKPNRKFLGTRMRLSFYYTFEDSERKFGSWMRDIIGEPPVLYDQTLITKNEEQIRLFLNELGYYDAAVSSNIEYRGLQKKKVVADYSVKSGKLFVISSVSYAIEDSALSPIINRTKNLSKIRVGQPFAIALLQEEQTQIVRMCNNSGYYAFSKDNVIFSADTTHGPDSVTLVISVKKTTENSLKQHRINKTTINQNYKPTNRRSRQQNQPSEAVDTSKATYIKPGTIQQANFIDEKEHYSLFRVERTQRIMSSYPLIKLVNIEFKESAEQPNPDTVDLDCFINITPGKRQSINFDIEGTNTSGDWGAALNTSYINRNLFHGAEYLNLKFKLAEEYNNVLKTENENIRIFNSQEYGISADFSTPKFLVPFSMNKYNKKFRARTNCHVEYNYLQTPDYTRPTTEVNFGYTWYGQRFFTYNFNPVDFSYIRYYNISDRFHDFINSRNYYKYSYEDYLLFCNNFSILYYSKRKTENKDYQYLKISGETSGNLMYLYCKASGKEQNTGGQYEVLNLPFAQYIKGEADFRYYDVISPKTTFVYRIFGGISVPYLNSEGLPSVKKYYAGGANSMRAWESRSLGLGSYLDTINSFKYYLGDVKIEMNVESRFHIIGILNGALFVDVGNIWSFRNNELKGAEIHLNNFYKDLAVGGGFGLRFDFSFLIVRCDLGMKIREPYTINNTKSHLIWGTRSLTRDDFSLSVGIGYPF